MSVSRVPFALGRRAKIYYYLSYNYRSRAAIVSSVSCDAKLHKGVAAAWGLTDGRCARRDARELERLCGRPQIFWRGARRRNLSAAGWSTSLRQC